MGVFKNKETKKEIMINNLLDIKNDEEMLEKMTTLQNEMSVGFSTRVIGVTSVQHDSLSASFAFALASTYQKNGEKSLVIDANMYNPCLTSLLKIEDSDYVALQNKSSRENYQIRELDKGVTLVSLNKEIYPSEVFKSGVINTIIEDNKDDYSHFIVIVPALKKHKEIYLLKDILDSIVLITQRNVTKKKDIYYSIGFLRENELPLAKTVVLK